MKVAYSDLEHLQDQIRPMCENLANPGDGEIQEFSVPASDVYQLKAQNERDQRRQDALMCVRSDRSRDGDGSLDDPVQFTFASKAD